MTVGMVSFLQLQAAAHSSRTLLYGLEHRGTQLAAKLAYDELYMDPPMPAALRRPVPRHAGYFAAYQLKPFGPSRYVP